MLYRPLLQAAPLQRTWLRSQAAPLAVAAVLVLALGLVLALRQQSPESENPSQPQTRYAADTQRLHPRLLAPAGDSVIQPLEQVFRWTDVPGTLFYDVQLVDADGDLLLRERVSGTRWLIPDNLHLQPGEDYFLRVDAYLSDAKYLSSEHLVFRVGGER